MGITGTFNQSYVKHNNPCGRYARHEDWGSPLVRKSKERAAEADVADPLATATSWIYRRIARYIGYGGLVLVVLATTIIWNWDEIMTRAPVRWAREQTTPKPELPKASGKRITIALADLENDPNGAHGRVLQTAVARKAGVEVLLLKRKVETLNSEHPQEDWARGHELARQMLRETRADVVIWGMALNDDAKGPMSLHWTLPSEHQSTMCPKTYRPNDSDLDLPALFWNDLHEFLSMLVATQADQLARAGTATEDPEPFIERIRTLLAGTSPGRDRVLIQAGLARALALRAERNKDLAAFREVIDIDRALLPSLSEKKYFALRTITQRQLGAALFRVASANWDRQAMKASVAALRAATADLPRDTFREDHAAAQSNLSAALIALSQMEKSSLLAQQAVEASRAAVMLTSREGARRTWSHYQLNLATALGTAGKMSKANALLEESVATFPSAIANYDRNSEPTAWGDAQFQYGLVLYVLATRTHDQRTMSDAAVAFIRVLSEQRPERRSHQWKAAQQLLTQTGLLIVKYGKFKQLSCPSPNGEQARPYP